MTLNNYTWYHNIHYKPFLRETENGHDVTFKSINYEYYLWKDLFKHLFFSIVTGCLSASLLKAFPPSCMVPHTAALLRIPNTSFYYSLIAALTHVGIIFTHAEIFSNLQQYRKINFLA